MIFPTACIDNFFDDPNEVRNFALSLNFNTRENAYPGVRTEPLHEIAPNYFNYFCKRLMGTFYDFRKFNSVRWDIYTAFQLTEPQVTDSCTIDEGWIHKDDNSVFAGVVYLTPNANLNSGTSIFKSKQIGSVPINMEECRNSFKDNMVNERTKQALRENNDLFVETITFKNVYNRLIYFGGEQFHGVNSFDTGIEPRLTQVFFVKGVYADWLPIPNSKIA